MFLEVTATPPPQRTEDRGLLVLRIYETHLLGWKW